LNVEGLDLIDALDLLAQQSGTFWQPLDSRTIQVLEDTQQNRRDHERLVVKTIYLPPATSTQELNEITNVLRTALATRRIFQHDGAKAILAGDTPERVAHIEKIIRQLNIHPEPVTSTLIPVRGVSETTVRGMASVAKSQLQLSTSGPISVNLNHDVKGLYEALARTIGVGVSFDPRVALSGTVHLQLDDVDPLDALDYLSFQTRTFWKVTGSKSILVAPDTREIHAELDPQVTKIYYLVHANAMNSNSIVNAIRTAFGVRQVDQQGSSSITILDTPQRVSLWEQVIASLDIAR
jgi:hypothetical protein